MEVLLKADLQQFSLIIFVEPLHFQVQHLPELFLLFLNYLLKFLTLQIEQLLRVSSLLLHPPQLTKISLTTHRT
jgi:hypothetical protein